MRIAVLSDVHANLVALDAVLADAGAVDAIWHLGDIVGYGPDPNGVVDRLRSLGALGIRGNHDAAACGGDEIAWFNPDARRAMEWTRREIDAATLGWLGALPERRTEGQAELVHGSHRDPLWEYVTSDDVARASLAATTAAVGLHGHTHHPVAWVEERGTLSLLRGRPGDALHLAGRRALLNPGSVGQPRDGNPAASYMVWEPEREWVTWHRVAYDIPSVQAAMGAAGLPASLAARLSLGL